MYVNEIENYLKTSSSKSVCIDRRLSNSYEGFVKDLIIMSGNRLALNFNTYGYDEGGLTLWFYFESLSALIQSVENYLGLKVENWENFTKTGLYPVDPGELDFNSGGDQLKLDLASRNISIPNGWNKMEVKGKYWQDIYDGITK